jgi:hypothetical protein
MPRKAATRALDLKPADISSEFSMCVFLADPVKTPPQRIPAQSGLR